MMDDYTKYLSVDNGKGLLIKSSDIEVLDRYGIDYQMCSSLRDLILIIGEYIDDNYGDVLEDLEEVLEHLSEMHYYQEVNK